MIRVALGTYNSVDGTVGGNLQLREPQDFYSVITCPSESAGMFEKLADLLIARGPGRFNGSPARIFPQSVSRCRLSDCT